MLEDRAGLDEAARAHLATVVARHHTLAEVIAWGLQHTPPLVVAGVIVQDEYTHDVVVPFLDGKWLVYDTT